MKLKAIILTTLLTATGLSSAYAQNTKTPYDRLIAVCNEIVGNGDCGIYKYDLKKLNYKVEAKKFVAGLNKQNQMPLFKRSDILSALDEMIEIGYQGEGYSYAFKKMITGLLGSKRVIMAFGAKANESCDETEYCSIAEAVLFTSDGYKIYILLDHTT